MFAKLALTLMLTVLMLSAGGNSKRRIDSDPFDEVIPQFVFGGGWHTSVSITNMEDSPVTIPINFYQGDGQAWQVPIVGKGTASTHSFVIPAKGTVFFETPDDVAALQQGWALLEIPCCPDVGGFAVFRQRVPGRPDFEAVVPFADSFEGRSTMIFDNTRGFVTGIAIVNPREFGGTTFTLVFRDEGGNRFHLDQITLGRLQKQVFVLSDRFPQTAGRRGSIEFQGVSSYIAGLGLRFNPGGAFTSFHTFEP